MAWKPPDHNDVQALQWLGIAGGFAAVVDLLKSLSERDERTFLQKIAHGGLLGVLSMGVGALQISVLRLPILAVIGISTIAAYLGADAILDLYTRLTGRRSSE